MATTKKQPTKKSAAPSRVLALKSMAKKSEPQKGFMQVPIRIGKSGTIKVAPRKAPIKKVVEKVPTLEQRLKRSEGDFLDLSNAYQALANEYCGLKNSFAMLKENHEREKNRLDKVIDTALNNSKTK